MLTVTCPQERYSGGNAPVISHFHLRGKKKLVFVGWEVWVSRVLCLCCHHFTTSKHVPSAAKCQTGQWDKPRKCIHTQVFAIGNNYWNELSFLEGTSTSTSRNKAFLLPNVKILYLRQWAKPVIPNSPPNFRCITRFSCAKYHLSLFDSIKYFFIPFSSPRLTSDDAEHVVDIFWILFWWIIISECNDIPIWRKWTQRHNCSKIYSISPPTLLW